MAVLTSGTARAAGIDRRALARKARAVLEHLGLGGLELSLRLVGDDEMRRLNRDWRGKDRPTDVLSFPLREGPHAAVGTALGDVVISLETAARQGRENGFTPGEEAERLLVHGILHLVGYDHEVSGVEAARMRRKEKAIRRMLAARLRRPGIRRQRGSS